MSIYGIYENNKIVYIGSTEQTIEDRKTQHWYNARNNAYNNKGRKIHRYMNEKGIDNFSFKLIEKYSGDNLLKREGEYQEKYKENLQNVVYNLRTRKIWFEENSERLKEYWKNYRIENKEKYAEFNKKNYEENKEKRLANQNQKINCICGSIISKGNTLRHEGTNKHLDYINVINEIKTYYNINNEYFIYKGQT